MPRVYSVSFERHVPVAMRDGVVLYADVYRPAAPGRFPVILQRTPYDKAGTVGSPAAAGPRKDLSMLFRTNNRMDTTPAPGCRSSPGRTAGSACLAHRISV